MTIVNSQELGQTDSNSAARVREATNVTKGGVARRREIFAVAVKACLPQADARGFDPLKKGFPAFFLFFKGN